MSADEWVAHQLVKERPCRSAPMISDKVRAELVSRRIVRRAPVCIGRVSPRFLGHWHARVQRAEPWAEAYDAGQEQVKGAYMNMTTCLVRVDDECGGVDIRTRVRACVRFPARCSIPCDAHGGVSPGLAAAQARRKRGPVEHPCLSLRFALRP